VAAVTSVLGAFFLDRYRFEAFRRSSLHAEEAEIAATLLKATEALSVHLGAADMLEHVNRLSCEATGCDWSSTFLFDESRGVTCSPPTSARRTPYATRSGRWSTRPTASRCSRASARGR
jgi:hypothetical protein